MAETTAAKAAGAGAAAGAGVATGLDQAAAKAGDVLRGIFGGLPWDLSPGGIVDAVTGGAAGAGESAAGLLVAHADVLAEISAAGVVGVA